MMAPRVAPMVRRMAMSAVLVRTSITRLDTMLKAATSTIMVSTMNRTLVWPWMAAKKPIVGLEPVEHPALRADRLGHELPARGGNRACRRSGTPRWSRPCRRD